MLEKNERQNRGVTACEESDFWEPLTLGEHLKRWAEAYRDRVALVEQETQVTYEELDRKADELAAGLVHIGIQKGDHVVVQLPNRISFVVACFALFRMGALPVLALPAHREKELDGIFSLAQPVAYLIPEVFLGFDYRHMAERLVRNHPSVRFVIADGNSGEANGLLRLADLGRPAAALEPPACADTALLLLSGGTTGVPKLIPRTHADYAFNAQAAAARCALTSRSVYLAVLPVAHNFPLCCPGILGTLSAGGKVVMCATTSCDEAFPLIAKERVTITALVPALLKLWLEELEWDKASDLSSLEVIQAGGALLDEAVAKRVRPEMNCQLQQVFGMAEGLICCTSLDDPDDVIHSGQGRPLSRDDAIRIVDEADNDVASGVYGELLVSGPYTIKGYYKAAEQNRQSFTSDGYYRSGDRARRTKDGRIQVGGRIKELINRAGEKIVPAEIEAYLCEHPDIQEAVLIGLPDEQLGERSCACLITNSPDLALPDIHRFFQAKGIARYQTPDQIELVDYWPLTSVGKIDKAQLKQRAAAKAKRERDPDMLLYHEETFRFTQDVFTAAARIAESGLEETYVLYENGAELSLGMGVRAMISVDAEAATLAFAGRTQQFRQASLSDNMEQAFSQVAIRNWRAYGIANFGLARHHHGLPLLAEDPCLLKLFIPEAEVRFAYDAVLLRALDPSRLAELGSLVKRILAEGTDPDWASRLERGKSNFPEAFTHNADVYMKTVDKAVQEIRQRAYHKVILSRKIPLGRELDMVASYIAGRKVNTPARSFLLSLDGLQAAGFSPETVVEVDEAGWVSTYPLAGTRSAGRSQEEQGHLRADLLSDPKEIAEHAVSVKLAFEELEQVCEPGSISVHDFMSVASRGTVQHLASRLKGKLKPGYQAWHAFHALYPAVTASGIPKKAAIEAIGRLEAQPRNLYSGCVMTVDSDGAMDTALVLRTIFQQEGRAWLQAGAGVVEMSVPFRELEETREKLSSFCMELIASPIMEKARSK